MALDDWLLFVAIWFMAGLPVGPNAINCVAVSAAQGFRRALWAVAGIQVAALLYIIAVVAGLGALLLANQTLFLMLKLAGAAYLIWMGIALLRKGPDVAPEIDAPKLSSLGTLRASILISLSNPKAMIAYGAVFSQFVQPGDAFWEQLAVIVPTAIATSVIIYSAWAAMGIGIGNLLGTVRRRLWFNRSIGGFYIFAGSALAASELSGMGTKR